jgi:hypothetical protein
MFWPLLLLLLTACDSNMTNPSDLRLSSAAPLFTFLSDFMKISVPLLDL